MNTPSPLSAQAANYAGMADGGEIDLRDLLAAISGGRWLLLSVALVSLALGIFYAWTAERIFDADALVQVEKQESGLKAALGEMAEMMGTPSTATAEIELLKSRMIVGTVVDGLGMSVVVEPHYFPIVGRAMARGTPAEELRGFGGYAWGGEHIDVPTFEVPLDYVGLTFEIVAVEGGYRLELEGEELFRGTVGERAELVFEDGARISLFVKDLAASEGTAFHLTRIERTQAIKRIQEKLKVSERGKDSGILQVSYSSPDPDLSREVVNRLVTAYQRQNIERRSAEAEQTLQFLERQLPDIRAKLEAAEVAFNNFRLSEGSADLTKETELILQQSVHLESTRVELEQRRQEALQRFTASHPAIAAIDRQLGAVQSEQDSIADRVKGLPETQQELLRLSRNVEVNTTLYTQLLNNFQELQVVKAGTIGNVRVVDYAVDPRQPSKPKAPLIVALSLVLGLFAGVAAIFVRRALRPAVNDPTEVERVLGIPTYAVIPYTKAQRGLLRTSGKRTEGQLLAFVSPQNIAVEAIRSLRTSLHFAMLDATNNVLMLTGPGPELGKSFVSINLGAVLAISGKQVVVIDADLRRGHLNEYINCGRMPGLSDYCAGQAELREILRKTVVDGLYVVPTGQIPPNPAELLLTDRFRELIGILSQNFDYVVIDTPPILAVTDAAIVGRVAGSTLLVLKAGEHSMNVIQDTASRLQNAGIKVSGSIFNQVGRAGTGSAKYGYGYAYHYQSYGPETK
ncbi:MAG: polysaccharide biosynthesis tyrosine autokinase [Pseudomonadota bacterium]|nr:polysaccharide biosynthesis tyrosine autokinase [Pseudomonadota bacterium]